MHLKGGWGQEFPHLWGQKLTSGFVFFVFCFFGWGPKIRIFGNIFTSGEGGNVENEWEDVEVKEKKYQNEDDIDVEQREADELNVES